MEKSPAPAEKKKWPQFQEGGEGDEVGWGKKKKLWDTQRRSTLNLRFAVKKRK